MFTVKYITEFEEEIFAGIEKVTFNGQTQCAYLERAGGDTVMLGPVLTYSQVNPRIYVMNENGSTVSNYSIYPLREVVEAAALEAAAVATVAAEPALCEAQPVFG